MFEGTEKKFEVLVPTDHPSLRDLGEAVWQEVVDRSRASILSSIANESCTAYLLSESSLFVFDHRVVMITCGRTSLVGAVQELARHVNPSRFDSFIFERKNENFPHLQPSTFDEDAATLNRMAPGTSLCFGNPKGHHLSLFHIDKPYVPAADDTTVEVLMYGLDPALAPVFSRNSTHETRREEARSRIVSLLPGFQTDDHFFAPHGYSFNGIRGPHYMTAHVTPEDPGAYASFETNAPLSQEDLAVLVQRLIRLFRPDRLDLALFHGEARVSDLGDSYLIESKETRDLACGYQLHFYHFRSKQPHAPRLRDTPGEAQQIP